MFLHLMDRDKKTQQQTLDLMFDLITNQSISISNDPKTQDAWVAETCKLFTQKAQETSWLQEKMNQLREKLSQFKTGIGSSKAPLLNTSGSKKKKSIREILKSITGMTTEMRDSFKLWIAETFAIKAQKKKQKKQKNLESSMK